MDASNSPIQQPSGYAFNPLFFAADLLDPEPDKYWSDPVAWVNDMFLWEPGERPTDYQNEIMSMLPSKKRVCVRGPHGLGKTGLASWLVLWFACTRDGLDWKIPTTASSWRQLEKFLWPEIRKWARRIDFERLGRTPFRSKDELTQLNLKLRTGQAFAAASDKPELIEGAHADHLLYIFDEAKAIPSTTFDAAEGAFSGAGEETGASAFAFCISTPGEPNGRFWEIQTQKPGTEDWWVRHVTLTEAIKAKRIAVEWVDQRRRQWGATSSVFINRVQGEFASSDEDGVIPLAWIEAAQDRWKRRKDMSASKNPEKIDESRLPPFTCVSCDVARSGSDKTQIAHRFGRVITHIDAYTLADTMETAENVRIGMDDNGGQGYAIIDIIGLGAGVFDRLRQLGYTVEAFNAAEMSDQVDMTEELGFVNRRSAAWWTLRELLNPQYEFGVEIPPSDLIVGDLVAPKFRITSSGKIQVESKDDIKKRLGRSTDLGDAIVMAFALLPYPVDPYVQFDDRVNISPY